MDDPGMRGAGLKSFIMKAIVSISQADVKQEPDPTVEDDGDDDGESDSEKSGSAIIREPLDADGEYHQIGSQELFPPPPATPPPPPAPTASPSPSPSSSGKSGPKKRAASPSEDNAPAPKAPHLNLGFKAYEVFISFHSFSFLFFTLISPGNLGSCSDLDPNWRQQGHPSWKGQEGRRLFPYEQH